jgi:hypothetical protein
MIAAIGAGCTAGLCRPNTPANTGGQTGAQTAPTTPSKL